MDGYLSAVISLSQFLPQLKHTCLKGLWEKHQVDSVDTLPSQMRTLVLSQLILKAVVPETNLCWQEESLLLVEWQFHYGFVF